MQVLSNAFLFSMFIVRFPCILDNDIIVSFVTLKLHGETEAIGGRLNAEG